MILPVAGLAGGRNHSFRNTSSIFSSKIQIQSSGPRFNNFSDPLFCGFEFLWCACARNPSSGNTSS